MTTSTITRRGLLTLGGLAAASLGGAALAGCVPAQQAQNPGNAEGPLTEQGSPGGEITIIDDNTNKVFDQAMFDEFEKATGVKVKSYTQGNFNDLHDRYATLFAAQDTSVDVIMTWAGWSAEFGQAGWLTELDPSVVPDDLIQPALDAVSWSDKVYGLPKFVSVQTMYWAKPLFTEADVDPDKAPANWDEFVTTAKALTTKGRYGYACDIGNPAGAYQNFLRVLLLNGGTMYDADYKPVFNSEQGVEALSKFAELLTVHKVMDPSSVQITNASDLGDLFAKGQTGMVFNWPSGWAAATASGSKLTKDTVGNGLIPGMSVRSASIDGSEGFAISKFSQNKQGALAWLKYASAADAQRKIVEQEGWLPTSKTVLEDKAIVEANPVVKTYQETTQYVTKRFGTPWSSELDQIMAVMMSEVMTGKTPAKEALDNAVSQTEPLVQKYLKR